MQSIETESVYFIRNRSGWQGRIFGERSTNASFDWKGSGRI